MKEIKNNNWVFMVDEEGTKAFYDKDSQSLECNSCENFYKLIENYSPKLKAFLDEFGVDINKPVEICDFGVDKKEKIVDCAAYYVVCGNVNGKNQEIKVDKFSIIIGKENSIEGYIDIKSPYFVLGVFNLLLKWDIERNIDEVYPDMPKKNVTIERLKQAFNK